MEAQGTVYALVASAPDDAVAIAAAGRADLTYGELRGHIDRTIASLNRLGIGRGDRVAIVLPNGPEMATAFLSIACGASTAPLNPGYRRPELEFYLSGSSGHCVGRGGGLRFGRDWRSGRTRH